MDTLTVHGWRLNWQALAEKKSGIEIHKNKAENRYITAAQSCLFEALNRLFKRHKELMK
jgi:hypothetical protein